MEHCDYCGSQLDPGHCCCWNCGTVHKCGDNARFSALIEKRDQRIAELEAELAESDKVNDRLNLLIFKLSRSEK
jgi:hypothetical protein